MPHKNFDSQSKKWVTPILANILVHNQGTNTKINTKFGEHTGAHSKKNI